MTLPATWACYEFAAIQRFRFALIETVAALRRFDGDGDVCEAFERNNLRPSLFIFSYRDIALNA
jgi:hypothetical protein